MTVIAYRSGIMACDSCWATYGTQTVSAIKIVRLSSGALLGSAGDNDCRAMYELLDKIKSPGKLPSRAEIAATKLDYEGLIAFPKGGVYMISTGRHDETGYPLSEDGTTAGEADYGVWSATTMGGYAAAGCGSAVALAAMDAGASAREAVQIACRRDVYCRLPIHVVRLHPAIISKKKRKKNR
jgi:hypothetical protein